MCVLCPGEFAPLTNFQLIGPLEAKLVILVILFAGFHSPKWPPPQYFLRTYPIFFDNFSPVVNNRKLLRPQLFKWGNKIVYSIAQAQKNYLLLRLNLLTK